MSEIAPATKDRLMDMFYAVYRQDADAVIACLQDLGIIVPTGDVMPLRRAIAYFLENINQQAERQETLPAIGTPSSSSPGLTAPQGSPWVLYCRVQRRLH